MSLARCIRCEAFFQLDGDDEARCCTYHPGVYRLWWSCCREPLQSATGCRRGTHVADPHATALLDSMCEIASSASRATGEETGGEQQRVLITGPDGVTSLAQAVLITRPTPITSPAPAPAPAPAPKGSAAAESDAAAGGEGTRTVAVPYTVMRTDTWSAIAMRHSMTSAELLRLNGLRGPRAQVGEVLLVWAERSDTEQREDWRRQLLRQFRRRTGCSPAEALYYLEGADFIVRRPSRSPRQHSRASTSPDRHPYPPFAQIGDAIRVRERDVQWERERAAVVSLVVTENEARRAADAAAAADALEHSSSAPPLAPTPDALTRAWLRCSQAAIACTPPAVQRLV